MSTTSNSNSNSDSGSERECESVRPFTTRAETQHRRCVEVNGAAPVLRYVAFQRSTNAAQTQHNAARTQPPIAKYAA